MVTQIWVNIGSGNGLLPDAWRHQAITWTNVDLSQVFCSIQRRVILISQKASIQMDFSELWIKNKNKRFFPENAFSSLKRSDAYMRQ